VRNAWRERNQERERERERERDDWWASPRISMILSTAYKRLLAIGTAEDCLLGSEARAQRSYKRASE
jgi:hypothetical protein